MLTDKQDEQYTDWAFAVMVALGMFVLWCFSGCNVEKRSNTKFYKALELSKITTGKNCNLIFPWLDSSKNTVEYKEGKPIPYDRPVYIDCDSAVKAAKQSGTTAKRIPCPPCDSLRVDTLLINTYYTISPKGYISELEDSIRSLSQYKDKYYKADKRANRNALQRNITWGILFVALLLWIVIKIKKPI